MSVATDAQKAFVSAVAARVPFHVTVTSWGRTPLEQASAMLKKHAAAGGGAAGDAELVATYGHKTSIQTLLSLSPRDAATWGAWIAAYDTTISRHLSGRAVDFSVGGLSRAQIEQLKAAIEAAGGRALEETAPPHVHADVSRTAAIAADATAAASAAASSPIVWLGVAAAAGAAWVFRAELGLTANRHAAGGRSSA